MYTFKSHILVISIIWYNPIRCIGQLYFVFYYLKYS